MHNSTRFNRKVLSATITAALLATGQSALLAQEQAGEAEGAATMEEIVVTATRREQTIAEIGSPQ